MSVFSDFTFNIIKDILNFIKSFPDVLAFLFWVIITIIIILINIKILDLYCLFFEDGKRNKKGKLIWGS